jgi:hypothetical protein
MKPKATIQIEISVCPEFEIAPLHESSHSDKFQKLIQRFLEDCSLLEISLSLEQFQQITEAFFEKSIRTRPHHSQKEDLSQMTDKHYQLEFPIDQGIFDWL